MQFEKLAKRMGQDENISEGSCFKTSKIDDLV